jgi:hypothetical protein
VFELNVNACAPFSAAKSAHCCVLFFESPVLNVPERVALHWMLYPQVCPPPASPVSCRQAAGSVVAAAVVVVADPVEVVVVVSGGWHPVRYPTSLVTDENCIPGELEV